MAHHTSPLCPKRFHPLVWKMLKICTNCGQHSNSHSALKQSQICPLIRFSFASKSPSPCLFCLCIWADNLCFWQTAEDDSVSLLDRLKEVWNGGPLTGSLALIYTCAICFRAVCVGASLICRARSLRHPGSSHAPPNLPHNHTQTQTHKLTRGRRKSFLT